MGEEFDVSARGIQHQMLEETRKAYGEVGFERWLKPMYVGTIDSADGYARASDPYGDTIEIFLRFGGERVTEATFQTNGCGASIVCGSFAAELSIGKTPDEIAQITGETILRALGDLPEGERQCAFLAAETLHEAIRVYLENQRRRRGSGCLTESRI